MIVLGVFFTRGISLKNWVETGLFEREILLYNRYIENKFCSKIYFFTYGVFDNDVALNLYCEKKLNENIIVVQCNGLFKYIEASNKYMYFIIMPLFIYKYVLKCDVLKTNQIDGSLPAILLSFLFKIPILVRTGYTLSRSIILDRKLNILKYLYATFIEFLSLKYCSIYSVTSIHDQEYLIYKYGSKLGNKIIVIRNYIDINLFSYREINKINKNKILYVGRLSEEKNIINVITASYINKLELDIIGIGNEYNKLKEHSNKLNYKINWLGNIPNNMLPEIYKSYKFFILGSLWEGMPKALLEAMSTGLVCIGTDTRGINEVIVDGYNGFLSYGFDHISLSNAIFKAITSESQDISMNGSRFVYQYYSFDVIIELEKNSIIGITK
jgi:glycosyltransferase involved in cell wall biosynthesis